MRYKTLTAFSYHRGDQVRVTVWAESVTGFQEIALKSLPPPVFIAFTALKVNQYQGYTTPSFNVTTSNSFLPIAIFVFTGKHVLLSTGSAVCFFNPDIPQLTEYKQKVNQQVFFIILQIYYFTNHFLTKNVQNRFQYLNLPVEILPNSAERYAKPYVTADSELKTIEELLLLNPTLNKVSSQSLRC